MEDRRKNQQETEPSEPEETSKSQEAQEADTDRVVREIDDLPPDKRRKVVSAMYSGPIPPATELQAYEQIVPGAADRIIALAEGEAEHRRRQEEKMVDSSCGDSRLGLWLGFFMGLAALVLSGLIACYANPYAGSVLAFTSIGSLVGVFVYGSRQQRQGSKQEKKD
jgi:uncharacterized membrane protein